MGKRPWLNAKQQVEYLKKMGVRFDTFSEEEAAEYLCNNSNYFRIRSYRNGFAKVKEGGRKGQYENLDFAMLVDLSIVDMLLRYEMLPMTLDIEHFSKVQLLQEIEARGEDGYEIVADFLSQNERGASSGGTTNRIKEEIARGKNSPYASELINEYPNYDFPAWSFIEVISFGTFCSFYIFCGERFNNKEMRGYYYLLQGVRGLRNACAHNQCIINDMSSSHPRHQLDYAVSRQLSMIQGIGTTQRRSKMNNERLQQIVTTLYLHKKIASDGVVRHRTKSLTKFISRMNEHLDYYRANTEVKSGFEFLDKVIKAWYPSASEGTISMEEG